MTRLLLTTATKGPNLPEPWNADAPLTLTTYDGTGETIHPSVVDMGTAWNGYRYWLADTPYAGGDNQLENPCVWASHDGLTWVVPPGVTNPLAAAPGMTAGFHSDTELIYDPDAGRMVLYYRLGLFTDGVTTAIELKAFTSTDGATWTDQGKIADLPTTGGRLSPAVVRVGVNDWRMWLWDTDSTGASMLTATSPLGPWSAPTDCNVDGGPLLGWHGDVVKIGGLYYMTYSAAGLADFKVATSNDGIAWTAPTDAVLFSTRGSEWDNNALYRPSLLPGLEPGVVRVWYSAINEVGGVNHYHIAYTRVPLSAWT